MEDNRLIEDSQETRILAICGGLRRDSYNAKLLRGAAASMPAGSELVQWGELRSIPPFSEDDEATPAPGGHRFASCDRRR